MRAALLLLLLVRAAAGQACYVSPEAAARSVVGTGHTEPEGDFRAAGVQVDAVMKRVWIRVARCSNASAPAVLVPVSVPLAAPEATAPVHDLPTAKPTPKPLLHPGDPVQAVYETSTTHMILEATANSTAGVGDRITLTLNRRPGQPPDEPEHRIIGTVRADRTVEVQP